MNTASKTVLFVCTGNSCRSVLAEALLNQLGNGEFRANSAGSAPAGLVHPQALACLERNRVAPNAPRSKSWDEFAAQSFDLVVTVCDRAAGESCPLFPGQPVKAHWGVPDPALATGTDAEIAQEFQAVFESLQTHIQAFINACQQQPVADLAELVAALGAPPAPRMMPARDTLPE